MTSFAAASLYLEKAEESLAAAESEYVNRRYNSCANRAYYACFQAAVAALLRAGIQRPKRDPIWSHAFVQAQFAAQINRQKIVAPELRDTLVRLYAVRRAADYAEDHVSQTQAARALRRASAFVSAVREKG